MPKGCFSAMESDVLHAAPLTEHLDSHSLCFCWRTHLSLPWPKTGCQQSPAATCGSTACAVREPTSNNFRILKSCSAESQQFFSFTDFLWACFQTFDWCGYGLHSLYFKTFWFTLLAVQKDLKKKTSTDVWKIPKQRGLSQTKTIPNSFEKYTCFWLPM